MNDAVEPEFWQGVEQFNQGQFYACHDTLEAIWMEAMEPQKTFYQGILQIAVALYHLSNQNLRGATILLGEGINRLRRYQPVYAGVEVSELIDQSVEWLVLLQQTHPEAAADLANQVIQKGQSNTPATGTPALPRISRVEIP